MNKVCVQVVQIVMGLLGVVTKDVTCWLNKIGVGDVVEGLQTSAIIRMATILQKVLFKSVN